MEKLGLSSTQENKAEEEREKQGSFSETDFRMEDFQESLSPSSNFSLSSSSSSSPITHPSSPFSFSFPSSSFSSSNPYPLSIDAELWLMAEHRTQEILWVIQPALVSEEKRKSIIGYFQRLIKGYYGVEVFPFGSVPLKTFLPDGDIDLTAVISHQNVEENLARYICNILENDKQNSEFLVQDVQYIRAQVKIVKCTVNDIPVDISFNQMKGLSALCFLEKVDQIVGKDHLFKRSIILIKAWCYYESRILGAHYGLISTYALETMILHIINIFHSSLCGPLAVLFKFLDYYSTFDWANYCVSITGPVSISSLPAIVAETPENDGDELLLSQDFLKHCREIFPAPMQPLEIGADMFPVKHFNVVDPLNENNNLGRSVSKGNFHRIKCALSFGAQRLRETLMLPGEKMGIGIEKFFVNTLDRNGRGQRPDVKIPVHAFGTGKSEVSDLTGDYDGYYNDLLYSQWYHDHALPVPTQRSTDSSSSQTQKKKCKRNIFGSRGTNVFIPRLSSSHPPSVQSPAATHGIDEMTESRGTGTYLPDMYSPEKNNPVEGSLEMDCTGNDECLDLDFSLEQFPLLPGIKGTMATDQCSQPTMKHPEAENCSESLPVIKFGTYDCSSSSGMHSPPPEQTDSGSWMPTIVEQEQEETCESDEEV